ncbi:putative ankyrin repeat protein RF_0580 [Mytilus edulis]|uniref:putative ankyrin repeat protein RF_0580 n=1 Tax=Mytilus edulis TaxID=6550 RepID=UPI0039EFAD04
MSDLHKKLYDAVSKNNVAEVSELLGRGASVNYQGDYYGDTPLHKAATERNVEIAELLIRNKADVNAPDNFGDRPLHKGINSYYNQGNMVMMVKSLIRLGAHVSVSNNEKATKIVKMQAIIPLSEGKKVLQFSHDDKRSGCDKCAKPKSPQ